MSIPGRILLAVFLCGQSLVLSAQLTVSGEPLAFHSAYQNRLASSPVVQLPALDLQALRNEVDQAQDDNRFSAPSYTDISPATSGSWTELPELGGRLWRCSVEASQALGLAFVFDTFRLAPGARFFIYSPDGARRFGAYSDVSCTPSGKFLIGIVPGSRAVLEYFEPLGTYSSIHLQRVDQVFHTVGLEGADAVQASGFGSSLPCNVNVNCPAGSSWQKEKKATARILMVFSNGMAWCSGSLIANTSGTPVPNFLTANHCQLIASQPDFQLWRFDFHYESPDCNNPTTEPARRSILGCERLAFKIETDFMLLRLASLPGNYDLYFNGWNRQNMSSISKTTFIHHPSGDIKKISVDNDAATIFDQTISWGGIFGVSPVNTHWITDPDVGIFQPGSSGSVLLDPNRRIVGQLHGGTWSQSNQCNIFAAYFGRFDLSWSAGIEPENRLSDWLDPTNTAAMTQNGYEQPKVTGVTVRGSVTTYLGVPLPGVQVKLTGGAAATAVTDTSGLFIFTDVPIGSDYVITPSLDSNYLNGVTTYDLSLISRHILGLEPFDSPWKIIAADINKSNSVTSFDIVSGRKVVLGAETVFPGNGSWRFFPAFATFPNPNNPFSPALPPGSISILNLQADYSGANFKAIKVGDVNNSATISK